MFSAMAAIWFLTAITMERAWVVLCITRCKQNRITKSKTVLVVMAIWISALVTSILPLLGWNRYIYEGYLYSSTVDYMTTLQPALSYIWLLMAIGWILPNVLIVMSHATVIWVYRYVHGVHVCLTILNSICLWSSWCIFLGRTLEIC